MFSDDSYAHGEYQKDDNGNIINSLSKPDNNSFHPPAGITSKKDTKAAKPNNINDRQWFDYKKKLILTILITNGIPVLTARSDSSAYLLFVGRIGIILSRLNL